MFIENKYKVWHDNIIANAQSRVLDCYKEKHHILPRCLGGNNKKENLVELTAKEHFIVHMLLCKFTFGLAKRSMLYAFKAMSYYKKDGRNYKIHSRIASKLRAELKFSKEHIKNLSESHKGKKASSETKLKMSKIHKGNKYRLGHKISDKTKQKLSKMRTGLIWINKDNQSKRIKKDNLQNYLNIGYKLGRDKSYLTKEYSLNMSKLTKAYWDRRAA